MKRASSFVVVLLALAVSAVAAYPQDDGDPLPLKSQWKGKLTQRGKIMGNKDVPAEFEVVLLVTGRKDNDFDCVLREKVGKDTVSYVCKGKLGIGEAGSVKMDFESISATSPSQDFVAVTRVNYSGAIKGKSITGTWKTPANKDDTDVEGTFTLERQAGL